MRNRTKAAFALPARPITIVVADDHPIIRSGVRAIVSMDPRCEVVGEAADGAEALEMTRRFEPDVLVLDLAMPKLPGLEVLKALTERIDRTKVIILTASIATPELLGALQLGARAVVAKQAVASELLLAISAVVNGNHWLYGGVVPNIVEMITSLLDQVAKQSPLGLTPRELEIVGLVAQGATNQQIADAFNVTAETVKQHLKNIFRKTGVASRVELAMFAVKNAIAVP